MPSPADFIAQAEGDWSVDRRTDRRGRRSFRSCGGTGPVSAVPMARLSLTPSARTARYWKAWEGAAPGGGSPRRRSRSAWSGRIMIAKPGDPTRRRSTKC